MSSVTPEQINDLRRRIIDEDIARRAGLEEFVSDGKTYKVGEAYSADELREGIRYHIEKRGAAVQTALARDVKKTKVAEAKANNPILSKLRESGE